MLRGFLLIFLPSLLVVVGVAALFSAQEARAQRKAIENSSMETTRHRARTIAVDMASAASDALFLSADEEMKGYLDIGSDESRQALANEFLAFGRWKGMYDQIRLIDESGMEVVRVNCEAGSSTIVEQADLQSKADRYYFRDTLRLASSQVYVSPFDLNVEHGEIEQPVKGVVRIGAPVFDRRGRKRGIVVLNIRGSRLFDAVGDDDGRRPGHVSLLNANGYWLAGGEPGWSWGFMFPDRVDRTFGKKHPEAWERIGAADSGQFRTSHGAFAFATVHPLRGHDRPGAEGAGIALGDDYPWKIVSHRTPRQMSALLRAPMLRALTPYPLLAAALAVVSWLLTLAQARRKTAEEDTRDAYAELDQIFNTSADGMCVVDCELVILKVNRAYSLLAGVSPEVCVGKRCCEVLPGPLCGSSQCAASRVLGGEARVRSEESRTRSDDESVSCIVTATPLRMSCAEPAGVVLNYTDITQRKEAEAALLASQASFHSIVERSDDGVAIVNGGGVVRYANRAATELLDQGGNGLVGGELPFSLEPGRIAEVSLPLRSGDGMLSAEVEVIETKWDGKPALLVSVRDVTARNRACEQVEYQRRQLIRADKMASLGALVSGVAREINNPNGVITLNLPLLRAAWQDARPILDERYEASGDFSCGALPYSAMREQIPHLIAEMEQGSERIGRIVSDLKDCAHDTSDESKYEMVEETVDS